MPKTAPKPQLTAVTALNPWCWAMAGTARRELSSYRCPYIAGKGSTEGGATS